MNWWRRSLVSRYHQRILDREASLRTRCYSRTPSRSAQHEDDGGKKRPEHMSNLEWMQLQHYERWRKRLLQDPYNTLFGPSNDMLKGKGLGDWTWVYKTFPKWMLQEMDVEHKPPGKPKDQADKPVHSEQKRGDVGDRMVFRQRDGSWGPRLVGPSRPDYGRGANMRPPPAAIRHTKPSQTEKEEMSGVVSPSDLRRPRESSDVKVVGRASTSSPKQETANTTEQSQGSSITVAQTREPFGVTSADIAISELDRHVAERLAREMESSQRSFIDEFLGIKIKEQAPVADAPDSKAWRQTSLQRRAASDIIKKPKAQTSSLQASEAVPSQFKGSREGAWISASDKDSPATEPKNVERLQQQESSALETTTDNTSTPIPRRSPAKILKQLPDDDLDFINADDIRASMGSKRSRLPSDAQKKAERQKLEQAFAAADEAVTINPITETQVVNDQYVRRAARQLLDPEPTTNATVTPPSNEPANRTAETATSNEPISGKKWLQTLGARFTNIFWQDPTEHTKRKLFFDKAAKSLKQGREAMRQVTEDLEKDVPASKDLLKQFKADEEALDLAIHRLRKRSSDGYIHGMAPLKMQQMQQLKNDFQFTNKLLEAAYDALQKLAGTDAVTKATGSFKRRLTAASRVLHKNAQLLRTLIWSLQARLEDPDIDRAILKNYKIVADRLLSLHDTEITLMRLVDRAMLVYGVDPILKDDATADKPDLDACEEPFVRARLAADAHLIKEIKAHKAPSPVAAEEAPAPTFKPPTSKILDAPNPLAHSLFRPFAPAVDSLSTAKELETFLNERLGAYKMNENTSLPGTKLVKEVKQAPENPYGKITADHEQGEPVAEMSKASEKQEVKKFEMLKEDPAHVFLLEPADKQNASTQRTPDYRQSIADTKDSARAADIGLLWHPRPDNALEAKTEASETTAHTPSTSDLPTHYIIIVRDPQTESMTITSTTTGPPRDTTPAVPLHQALAALDSPAKFIPHIADGHEVVSAKQDMLVLRDVLDPAVKKGQIDTHVIPGSSPDSWGVPLGSINPIDGTTRLSPTGYMGPEETREQIDKAFEERRNLAGRAMIEGMREHSQREERRSRRAGVFKTAIWVAGICYVAGVIGEIASGP